MNLAGKKIVLGLTGGIACYKAAEFTRALIKAGATGLFCRQRPIR